MWQKPHVLNAMADLLYVVGAAALLAAGAVWLARWPSLPVRQVVFVQELQHVRRLEVQQALPAVLQGNFFSVNLEAVRGVLEKLPWIRKVEVRRVWPARLEIRVEEHQPVARWEDGRGAARGELVNSYGEVFAAALGEEQAGRLPQLHGPLGTAPEVLKRYGEFVAAFRPVGRRPSQVVLSPRLAWQIRLDNAMVVDLGREQPKSPVASRLQRFVEVYPETVAKRPVAPGVVDLRYPNGFALRAGGTEGKGS